MHGSLSEAGPESSDRRVGTKEFGAESWDRGSVRSLPEVGPQSSDLRVGTRELGPGVGTRGSGPGVHGESVGGGARELGPESWDQRGGTRELGGGRESAGGGTEVGATEFGPESWDQTVGTKDFGPMSKGVRQKWNRCWEQRVETISWGLRVGTRCGCVADDANSDAFLFM